MGHVVTARQNNIIFPYTTKNIYARKKKQVTIHLNAATPGFT